MGAGGLIAALVLLVGINTMSNAGLQTARIDLTENRLYTLTSGTRNILKGLEDPVTLRFFYSEKLSNKIPQVKSYGTRIKELLQEYEAAANGKIKLEVIDPEPFSEAEDKAVAAGIQGVPISQNENIYLGLEGRDQTDIQKVIPYFDLQREEFLEYEISQLVYNLSNPEKKKVVVLSNLPVNGDEMDAMARMSGKQPQNEPWVIIESLRNLYEVEVMKFETESLPDDMDALMIIHPKGVPEKLQYQIDQYALRGGKIAVFVDQHAEVETPVSNPSNPLQGMSAPRASDMPKLFEQWGIQLVENRVAGDRKHAIEVPTGNQSNPRITDFIVYLNLRQENLNQQEVITSQLDQINIGMAGILEKREGATTEIVPLMETSEDSMQVDVEKVRMFPDPAELLKNFKSEGKKQILAARISGNIKSAFPEGPSEGEKSPTHLTESSAPLNAIVFTDVDFLTDRFWVQAQRMFGQRMLIPIAKNGDLIANAVDQLSGSSDLISIRSRGKFNRPFSRVEAMEKAAQERLAEQIKTLEEKLSETEKKLQELQQAKAETGVATLTLSPEQEAEVKKFQQEKLDFRKKLRELQLSLRQDVEQLGTKLKLANTLLVPLLIGFIAVGLGIYRSNRRRRR
jgi:ABC-type uncharacterized transport system involved in gliding motility auxiliary subunit